MPRSHPLPPSSPTLPRIAMGLVFALASAAASAEALPHGTWITANGNLEVEVAPCGAALCGVVTKVLGNRSMSRDGEEMKPVDTRPALGMKILHNFVPETTEDNQTTRWEGEIYNRENGKTYNCLMSLDTSGNLVLRPYVGIPLFGKTQLWHRIQPRVQVGAAEAR